MNAPALPLFPQFRACGPAAPKERFRARFQQSLRACARRGFAVEEAFGMIWEETWDEITLNEEDQSELYQELIHWAKSCGA